MMRRPSQYTLTPRSVTMRRQPPTSLLMIPRSILLLTETWTGGTSTGTTLPNRKPLPMLSISAAYPCRAILPGK